MYSDPPLPLLVPRAKREDGCKDFGDYKLAPIIQANVMYRGIAMDDCEEHHCFKDHENNKQANFLVLKLNSPTKMML